MTSLGILSPSCKSVGYNRQVERGDLQSEVGINGAVPQLKIMKAIKTRFPEGV